MTNSFITLSEDHYNELTRKVDKIISFFENNSESGSNEILAGKWVTEKKAQEMTGKKATTLWKMRNAGELTFTKLNNKVYYDLKSILDLLEKNKQEAYK